LVSSTDRSSVRDWLKVCTLIGFVDRCGIQVLELFFWLFPRLSGVFPTWWLPVASLRFPEILSQLERALQDLFEDIQSINRGQELIKLHLSKVGLLFDFSQAYSPRPPKEIVAHHHYSPARLTVTACSTSGWVPFYQCQVGLKPQVPEEH